LGRSICLIAFRYLALKKGYKISNAAILWPMNQDYIDTVKNIVDNGHPQQQYNSSVINIEKISAARFSISVDNNVHRLHSPLSNLRSELRNCLTYATAACSLA